MPSLSVGTGDREHLSRARVRIPQLWANAHEDVDAVGFARLSISVLS